MKKYCLVPAALALVLALTASACSSQQPVTSTQPTSGPVDIHIWGGSPGGSYEPLMVAVGELFKKGIPGAAITNEPVGGSSAVAAVANNRGQFGLGMAINVGQLYTGQPPFDTPNKNIRIAMVLFPSVNQIAVRADAGIKTIADLRGKRVNVGTKGLVTEIFAKKILEQYGLSYEDVKVQYLGFSDAVQQMIDGHLDADFMTGALPKSDFINLSEAIDMDLIGLSQEVVDNLVKANPGVVEFTIPAGTYKGVEKNVLTIATPTVFITNAEVSDDLVYQMTRIVYENMDQLGQVLSDMKKVKPEEMVTDLGIPFHTGAVKFYREKGLM